MFDRMRSLARALTGGANAGRITTHPESPARPLGHKAEAAIDAARLQIAALAKEEKAASRVLVTIESEIAHRETQAKRALATGRDSTARDLAERIIHLENDRDQRDAKRGAITAALQRLQQAIDHVGETHDAHEAAVLALTTATKEPVETPEPQEAESAKERIHATLYRLRRDIAL